MTSVIVKAMIDAAALFGGSKCDGVFNAACFSTAFKCIANLHGTIDGNLVAAILEGRNDVERLKGGSHYRIKWWRRFISSTKCQGCVHRVPIDRAVWGAKTFGIYCVRCMGGVRGIDFCWSEEKQDF